MSNNIGKVVQVIGPVVDVRFDAGIGCIMLRDIGRFVHLTNFERL